MLEAPGAGVTQDEKLLSMISHVLGFFTSFIGPLIIYLIRRDSKFVAFHSLQEVFFQLGLIVAWTIVGALWVFLIGIPLSAVLFIGEIVYIILASIKAYNGEWFEYWFVGPLARRTVGA